jgi:hypothetical protein
MEIRIAKLKQEQEKASQALADTMRKEQQLLENRLKLKQEQDAKDKWKLELQRQEKERRDQIRWAYEEKKRKLDRARAQLLSERRVRDK